MPTRDALCRESLEEQIRKHTAAMSSTTALLNIEGCENLSNSDDDNNNNDDGDDDDNDNDDDDDDDGIEAERIKKSSSTYAENPGPSEIVSAIVERGNSCEQQDPTIESTNSIYGDEIQPSDSGPIAPMKLGVFKK
ncbi:hypothetical protein LOAG_13096 [Loa loa]|uniref:Uncharacterized protein n=1 Tax=Loa loa TaxID=7209 RepID=A0A1S0TLG9_LOALO|nr:hypothetical protein LOAG_13096 [Loa loa]EFO15414.1 hypothetical protein LOAG_13096 [Loa loa]